MRQLRTDVPVPLQARTASGQTDWLSPPADATGVQINVDVQAHSGGDATLVAVLEAVSALSDGIAVPAVQTVIQTAAITGTGGRFLLVAPDAVPVANQAAGWALCSKYRIRWVIAGTSPNITFGCTASFLT